MALFYEESDIVLSPESEEVTFIRNHRRLEQQVVARRDADYELHPAVEAYITWITGLVPDSDEGVLVDECYIGDMLKRISIQARSDDGFYDEPAFLDTVAAWLKDGDAVDACATFENYLIVVICLLADMADERVPYYMGDRQSSGGSMLMGYLRDGEEAWGAEEYWAYRQEYPNRAPLKIFSSSQPIARLGFSIWQHPALSRTTWNMAEAARRGSASEQ